MWLGTVDTLQRELRLCPHDLCHTHTPITQTHTHIPRCTHTHTYNLHRHTYTHITNTLPCLNSFQTTSVLREDDGIITVTIISKTGHHMAVWVTYHLSLPTPFHVPPPHALKEHTHKHTHPPTHTCHARSLCWSACCMQDSHPHPQTTPTLTHTHTPATRVVVLECLLHAGSPHTQTYTPLPRSLVVPESLLHTGPKPTPTPLPTHAHLPRALVVPGCLPHAGPSLPALALLCAAFERGLGPTPPVHAQGLCPRITAGGCGGRSIKPERCM